MYRPWNLYCVQLDSKSSPEFQAVIQKLLRCHSTYHSVDNIILMPPYNMVWQHSSLLEGDLACLSQLLNRSHHWQYYVNVVGSEYPIMTNLQLIEKLKQVSFIRKQIHI